MLDAENMLSIKKPLTQVLRIFTAPAVQSAISPLLTHEEPKWSKRETFWKKRS